MAALLLVALLPAPLAADILVSGPTSTLRRAQIVELGQQAPATFSGAAVKNTPGFRWYASRHYALKTDLDDDRARHYLELLELAHPHYVALFGREPPGADRLRFAVCYAKDQASLAKALEADGVRWQVGGGGITIEANKVAYQYPSGGLEYHKRYILLHECCHQFQMGLAGTVYSTPAWFHEGLADAFASHVWDEGRRRLTVGVVDKATVLNFHDDGLARFRAAPFGLSAAHERDREPREVGFLLVNYFQTDPERALKFRLWRDELMRLGLKGRHKEASERLLVELFGPLPQLDADFRRWAAARRASFHYVDWGWEQDGDTLRSYGWPQKGAFSQTDVLWPPGEEAAADPLVTDYPHETTTHLVGPVPRGGEMPAVGCLLSFADMPGKGQAGLGLGTRDRSCLRALIDACETLVLDGADLGLKRVEVPLPDELKKALRADGWRVGLTVTLRVDAVEAVARAGPEGRTVECKATLAVDETQRDRLMREPLTLLSRDNRHRMTPFVGLPRPGPVDLSRPAPANRWRNPGEGAAYACVKSAWRLRGAAPAELLAQRQALLAAADKAPRTQREALTRFHAALPEVLDAVRRCDAGPLAVRQALDWLEEQRAPG